MVVGFYYAMNMANIYVVLKDGMAYRAQVVMMGADAVSYTHLDVYKRQMRG